MNAEVFVSFVALSCVVSPVLRCADPAGGVQEADRSYRRLQPLLWQEKQTQREEKILQYWAVLPKVSSLV